jgi:hypothetical protein
MLKSRLNDLGPILCGAIMVVTRCRTHRH